MLGWAAHVLAAPCYSSAPSSILQFCSKRFCACVTCRRCTGNRSHRNRPTRGKINQRPCRKCRQHNLFRLAPDDGTPPRSGTVDSLDPGCPAERIAIEALGAVVQFMTGHEPHAADLEHGRAPVPKLERMECGEVIDPSHVLDVVHVRDTGTQLDPIHRRARRACSCRRVQAARPRQARILDPPHHAVGPWASRLRRYRHE